MRYLVMVIIGVGLLGAGLAWGRYSVENSTPLLPTRIPATPENFLEQIQGTKIPYGLVDITPTPMGNLSDDLQRGKKAYELCSHCHGELGAGEPGSPNPNIPDAYGFMPVPRHDSFGHTWHHPDQLLKSIIVNGSINPLYRQTMPPFGAVLTDEEVDLVMDYMKLWWTEEQREQQAAATERMRLAQEQ